MRQQASLLLHVSLLKCGVIIDRTSFCITLLSTIMLFLQSSLLISRLQMVAFFIIVLVGFAQKYYAIRVSLDAEIFAQLAGMMTVEPKTCEIESELRDLDNAMLHLGLIKASEGVRSLSDRCQGAFKLLKSQTGCLAIQCVVLLCTLLVQVIK